MNKNIIRTVEGTIKDGERGTLEALMCEMVETIQKEEGTLNYEWTLAEGGASLHVYERYKDADYFSEAA